MSKKYHVRTQLWALHWSQNECFGRLIKQIHMSQICHNNPILKIFHKQTKIASPFSIMELEGIKIDHYFGLNNILLIVFKYVIHKFKHAPLYTCIYTSSIRIYIPSPQPRFVCFSFSFSHVSLLSWARPLT